MNVEIRSLYRTERIELLPKLTIKPGEEPLVLDHLLNAAYVWSGEVDGELACVLCAIVGSLISDKVYLWFTETAIFHAHRIVLARRLPTVINTILARYPIIIGHCAQTDFLAQRWIKWMGGKFIAIDADMIRYEIRAR